MKDVKSRETAISERVENLSKVDTCFSELYSRAIEQEGAVPTTKAVLLNLIIYAAELGEADSAVDDASHVLSAVSCRAIIADLSTSEQSEGASLSLVCGISDRGDKRLCGEVIRLFAQPGSVTGSVMPLLIPDVPVYLWVHGEIPPEREDFADLLRVASHVIADSRVGPQTARNLRSVQRLSSSEGGRRIVQDLAWISIQAWREATAQHFDPPAVRHCLGQIAEITIRYSGPTDASAPESPPLLFAAWLMERTQMVAREAFHSRDEGFRIEALQDDKPVILRLVAEESDRESGQLLSVVMKCGLQDDAGVFTTESVSENQLSLREECRDVCLPPKTIDIPSQEHAGLAAIALGSYRRDRVFAKALDAALVVLGQMELADERSARFRL